jgi:DNA-binding Lrp family transcriptional regulator
VSNHLISETYKRQVGSMARKAVMVLLADKASDDGTGIWASKQRMAEEIGASKQTIIATIKSLRADGLIAEIGQRKSPNGYTVEYAINVTALRRLPVVKSHQDDQSESLTGQAALPVKEADPTGQAALPDQSSTLTQTPLNPPEPTKDKNTQTRAHVLPANWWPREFGANTQSRAVVDGWPPGELERQVEHFTAHHRGKGNRFTDWQDAWSTWALNSRRFGNGRPQRNGFSGQGTTRDLGAEVAAEFARTRGGGAADDLPRIGPPGRVYR